MFISGLSKLTSDSRPTIRKGALEVLFNILKDHGHLFSRNFWANIFKSVIFPIYSNAHHTHVGQTSPGQNSSQLEENPWDSETDAVAAQCLVDLFVHFFDVVRWQLTNVIVILTDYLRIPYHKSASTGVASFLHLTGTLGSKFSENEWIEILIPLKQAVLLTQSEFSRISRIMHDVEIPNDQTFYDAELLSENEFVNNEEEEANMETASYAIVKMKGHIAVQLLIVQVILAFTFLFFYEFLEAIAYEMRHSFSM